MKKICLMVLMFNIVKIAMGQSDSAYIEMHYNKKEVYIQMRDGVKLFTSIYSPKDQAKKYAIMLNRTPYCVCPYGDTIKKENLGPSNRMMEEKYIFVYQDVRGRYMSEGKFQDIRPFEMDKKGTEIDESSDTYDTVEWLIQNLNNNNGNVGVWGISYPGFYASMAALSGHPAIKAVSPQAPVTNWFLGDDFHHNGAFFLNDGFSFYSFFGQPRSKPTHQHAVGLKIPTPDGYDFFLKLGALKNVNSKYFNQKLEFWNDLMKHPDYDQFWKKRDIRASFKNIKPAIMTVGGFFDAEDCWGALQTYKSIEKQSPKTANTIVMGPWFHGGWARSEGDHFGDIIFGSKTSKFYRETIEAPFFSHYLYGKGVEQRPEAIVFDIGSDQWTSYNNWPPKQSKTKKLFLEANGGLKFEKNVDSKVLSYYSDPAHPVPHRDGIFNRTTREYMIDDQRFASRRPDVLTYSLDIIDKPLKLAGPLYAEVYISTEATDIDIIVKIIDVYPDTLKEYQVEGENVKIGGYQMLVRGEVMRAKYRESFESPKPLTPKKVEKVRFYLPDVAHTFRKGHKLMVQLQSSWFPLVDRNPQNFCNIYEANDSDFLPAWINVHHGGQYASNIELSVIEE